MCLPLGASFETGKENEQQVMQSVVLASISIQGLQMMFLLSYLGLWVLFLSLWLDVLACYSLAFFFILSCIWMFC